MENRLFLLEPGSLVPSGLTENILSGVDVTPEKDYAGKITLTQLNAYSGELKAEALTNFQTIKIEKDGSETYTNVAKLLLELQQGGGVEDAIEEAIIEIDSKKGDAEIRNDLMDLNRYVEFLHNTPRKYEALFSDAVTSVEEYFISVWRPSIEDADGERTRFFADDVMSRTDEQFLVVLNGVIVTPEDGSVIVSEFGAYIIGFEFNVAPSVGDIVEFNGTRVTGKSSAPYADALRQNEAILDDNKSSMNVFKEDTASAIAQKETDKANAIAEITELEAKLKDLQESRDGAYEAMLSASSIAEVKEHSEKVKSLDETIQFDLRADLIAGNWGVRMIDSDLKSIIIDQNSTSERYEKIRLAAESAGSKFNEKIAMFNSIRDEQNGVQLA